LFVNKIVNQARNSTVTRLSVNEEFRNEIAKRMPFFARQSFIEELRKQTRRA
jgi:hypothetical protein